MTLIAGRGAAAEWRRESRPLAAFRGQRVHAVAGIGNPQRFFRELRAQGMELIEHPSRITIRFTAAGSGLRR